MSNSGGSTCTLCSFTKKCELRHLPSTSTFNKVSRLHVWTWSLPNFHPPHSSSVSSTNFWVGVWETPEATAGLLDLSDAKTLRIKLRLISFDFRQFKILPSANFSASLRKAVTNSSMLILHQRWTSNWNNKTSRRQKMNLASDAKHRKYRAAESKCSFWSLENDLLSRLQPLWSQSQRWNASDSTVDERPGKYAKSIRDNSSPWNIEVQKKTHWHHVKTCL